jgi:hypothetical protein
MFITCREGLAMIIMFEHKIKVHERKKSWKRKKLKYILKIIKWFIILCVFK